MTMRLEPMPCWGRAGAAACNDCTLLQMPADYAGTFPEMELQMPAVVNIGAADEFCPERRSAGAVVPGPSVSGVAVGVCTVSHEGNCAPAKPAGVCLTLGPSDGGGQNGAAMAFRNAHVTGAGV